MRTGRPATAAAQREQRQQGEERGQQLGAALPAPGRRPEPQDQVDQREVEPCCAVQTGGERAWSTAAYRDDVLQGQARRGQREQRGPAAGDQAQHEVVPVQSPHLLEYPDRRVPARGRNPADVPDRVRHQPVR